jgi:hypothetical protein
MHNVIPVSLAAGALLIATIPARAELSQTGPRVTQSQRAASLRDPTFRRAFGGAYARSRAPVRGGAIVQEPQRIPYPAYGGNCSYTGDINDQVWTCR